MATGDNIITLYISMEGCHYDIRVNDVPIFRDFTDGWPLTSTRSVNEYLRQGVNCITVVLTPSSGRPTILKPHGALKVGLASRPHAAGKLDDQMIATAFLIPGAESADLYQLVPGVSGVGVVSGPGVVSGDGVHLLKLSLDIVLHGPAHSWRWLNGQPMLPPKEARTALERAYTRIHEALSLRRTDWIFDFFTERRAEMALALFESEQKIERENQLYVDAQSSEMTLYPLQLEDAELLICGDQRLARLTRWDGLPILLFHDQAGVLANYYPMTFRCERDELKLCR